MRHFEIDTHNAPDDDEKRAWLRLSRTRNIGPVTFYKLVDAYGSASEALDMLPELSRRGGRKTPLQPPSKQTVDKELDHLARRYKGQNTGIITAMCPSYPLALGACEDAPPVLSYAGDLSLLNKSCIAIVGARNASMNGRKFAFSLAQDLGRQDQVIVSGLARGIDTSAHKGSLETGTVAVVAGGLDVIYPPENDDLHAEIIRSGVVLAESPLGQKPFAQSFPRRNRIVSGIAKGAVVIEATMRSGSLITARLAGEQGRDVFAVPGHPWDPRAKGTNHLLRQGAVLARSADDILEALNDFSGGGLQDITPPEPVFQAPIISEAEMPKNAQDAILNHLSPVPVDIDELIRLTAISVPVAHTVLLELELAGRIKRLPGHKVCIIHTPEED